jgi:hypothetical protein
VAVVVEGTGDMMRLHGHDQRLDRAREEMTRGAGKLMGRESGEAGFVRVHDQAVGERNGLNLQAIKIKSL